MARLARTPVLITPVPLWMLTLAATLVAPLDGFAAPPDGFSLQVVTQGYSLPTAFAFAPDGELWVAEKSGRVWVEHDGGSSLFLDIADEVNEYNDRGLLGLALDPDFETTGWVYLFVTLETDPFNPDAPSFSEGQVFRIKGTAIDHHTADPLSRTVLLAGFDNHHYSHSGGCVRFDADDNLIVSFGDGSSYEAVDPFALNTYDASLLTGKIVRVDRTTGDGVPGNPYYDALDPSAVQSKIIARGFRNPFRFAIDPATGDVYVGDVGWNAWEEVDRVPAIWSDPDRTLNFGWPCYEGAAPDSLFMDGYRFDSATAAACEALYPPPEGTGIGATAAVYAYDHSGAGSEFGSAVIAGAFYTGVTYPPEYDGRLFIADYARDLFELLSTDGTVVPFGSPQDWGNPVDIQMAPTGNIAYAAIGHGAIYEIVFDGANRAPTAVATADVVQGPAPLRVRFSGLSSTDPDDDRLVYTWDFDDGGKVKRGKRPRRRFQNAGTYRVSLTVTDRRRNGLSDIDSITVLAGHTAPTVSFVEPGPATTYGVGEALAIEIDADDAEDGALTGASVHWQPVLHHLGHLHYLPTYEGETGTFVVLDHGDDSFIEIRATATDSLGASTTVSITPAPRRQQVTIDAVPSGLSIVVDGQSRTTPYTWDSIEGGTHGLTAISPQDLAGTTYELDSWSDGLAESHTFVTPAAPLSLTATYLSQ